MYKLCFLLACFACDSHGRRLKVALDQDFSSQDAAGQQLMKQQSWKAGSSAHVKANRSGSRQFGEVMPDPRKAATILLTFLFPAAVFAPMTLSAPGLFKQAYVRQFRQQWDGTAFDSPALVARQAERDAATSASTRGSSQSNVADADSEPLAVPKNNSSSIHATPDVWGPTVRVFVCVYWEGLYLRKQNLRFFNAFREAHPDVALTHFMNAAYFTKSEVQSMHESGAYQAFGPADEVGIQVNGLKSLVESSGVQYRSEPCTMPSWTDDPTDGLIMHFLDWLKGKLSDEEVEKISASEQETIQMMQTHFAEWIKDTKRKDSALDLEVFEWHIRSAVLNQDAGYDTDMRAYSVDELRATISQSKKILEKEGLKIGEAFRVGTRLAGPNVLEAFKREGFNVNSSALSLDKIIERLPPAHRDSWKDVPLVAMVREVWSPFDLKRESQPFLVKTPAGWVLEMPEAAGPAEQNTFEDMVDHIDSAVQRLGSGDQFLQLTFQQETAATYGPRVMAAITEIKRKHGHWVVFETLEASVQQARSMKLKELGSNGTLHVIQNS